LADAGLAGWVVGSRARGRFNENSDVVFVVDCERLREYDAFLAIEQAMKDFPFHIIPFRRLKEDALPFMMEDAIDAASMVARQAEA
jgi:predicted nucleotidyltransferase